MIDAKISEITSLKNNIAEKHIETNDPIPFYLLLKPENKTTNLWLNSPNQKSVTGASRIFSFDFREPVFISQLEIKSNGYSNFDDFRIGWTDATNMSWSTTRKPKNGAIEIPFNKLVTSINFTPPKKTTTNNKILSVSATGLKLKEFHELLNNFISISSWKQSAIDQCEECIKQADQAKATAAERSEKISQLQQTIETLEENKTTLTEEIEKLNIRSKSIRDDIQAREMQLIAINNNKSKSETEIKNLESKISIFNNDIADKTNTLKSLKENINMFPTELRAFSEQGSRTSWLYALICAVPIAILSIMTWTLLRNAADLTTVLNEDGNARVWSILLTRTPYVIVATSIVAASTAILKMLFNEVVKINTQRLNLSKISIIATDISKSAEIDLHSLDDEDIYEKRVQLKMALLREHLKTYIPSEVAPRFPKIRKPATSRTSEAPLQTETHDDTSE